MKNSGFLGIINGCQLFEDEELEEDDNKITNLLISVTCSTGLLYDAGMLFVGRTTPETW